MKRLSSFKGFEGKDVASFSVPPPSEEGKEKSKERFQSLLLDGMDEVEEEEFCSYGQSSLGEKKRRLSIDQVKALEKNFEVENKLDPERKVRLAQEVGLQPRQVAIWFQNRRARWKTKQLERNYGVLKARHDALKLDYDALLRDKEALEANVKELKDELARSGVAPSKSNNKDAEGEKRPSVSVHKDGASDSSDSSVVFSDEASPYSGVLLEEQCFMGLRSQCSSSLLFENKLVEEINYCEEPSTTGLFSTDQAPSLSWYFSEGWD
ncbi:hypothetical protein Cni_G02045 [Canna indica]|uniref:Homeobox-leucine zipper protein n=1 Tax=Canna indica TaxID=4628 RepID=A0AAQ3JNP4_9LILI|nr:hypothetical protein Cni_G02045 [Canna indica]